MKNNTCPDCGKDKIYMSRANVYVCGYEPCGTIFTHLPSETHLRLRQIIASGEQIIEIQKNEIAAMEKLIKNLEKRG